MAILVSGSLVYDHIMNFPDSFKNHIMPEQIHILNVCFMVDKLERSWGGTAGNIAFTMKMLGGEPLLLSVLGKDGRDYLEFMNEFGIKTDYILSDKKRATASAYITTDADDNQITAFFGGPLAMAKDKNISELIPTLGEHGSVINTSDGEIGTAGVCAPLSFDDPTVAGDSYRAGFFV